MALDPSRGRPSHRVGSRRVPVELIQIQPESSQLLIAVVQGLSPRFIC
mgnify:CR=1 FL=1